MQKNHIT